MPDPQAKPEAEPVKTPPDWLPSLDDENSAASVESVKNNRGRKGGAELHPDDAE